MIHTTSYPVALFLDGATDLTNENLPDGIGYILEVLSDDTVLSSSNIDLSLLSKVNSSTISKRLSIILSDTRINSGDTITYKIKTVYNYGKVNEVVLSTDTFSEDLPIIGSKSILTHNGGTNFTNALPTLTLKEHYSNVGIDIDGNNVDYYIDVKYDEGDYVLLKHYSSENISNELIVSLNLNDIIEEVDNTLFLESGTYTFRVNDLEESEVELKYDITEPRKPTITFYSDYTDNRYETNVTNNTLDIKVTGLSDGPEGSGLSSLVISRTGFTENLTYDISGVIGTTYTLNDIVIAKSDDSTTSNITRIIQAMVYDRAGNQISSDNYEVVIDKKAPVISSNSYAPVENGIKYSWISDEPNVYKIGEDGLWSKNYLTTGTYTQSGLLDNASNSLFLTIKDSSGNETSINITGYTLDTFDTSTINFSTINNGIDLNKFIRMTINNISLDKFTRLTVSGIEGSISGTYSINTATYDYKYNTKQEYTFNYTLKNTNNDINDGLEEQAYIPVNFAPVFTVDISINPVNEGYSNTSGTLTWPSANDLDGETVNYIVTIKPDSGVEIEFPASTGDPLTDNTISISTLLGTDPVKDETYTWNVIATDNTAIDLTDEVSLSITDYSFSIDDTVPVIGVSNNKNVSNTDYTDSVSFTITDNPEEDTKNSGLSNVTIKVRGLSYTNYTEDSGVYTINPSDFTSGPNTINVIATDNVALSTPEIVTILYDKDIPELTTPISSVLISDSTEYFNNGSSFDVQFNTSDDASGVSCIYYGFYSIAGALAKNITWTLAAFPGSVVTTEVLKTISVDWSSVNGVQKYLYIKVIDSTGKESVVRHTAKPIYTDTTSPVYDGTGTISGFYSDTNYLTSLSDLVISATFTDSEETLVIGNYQYLLKFDGVTSPFLLKDYGESTNRSLTLVSGTSYTLEVKARNKAGGIESHTFESLDFIYDGTAPTAGNITLDSEGKYLSGDNVKFTIEATEEGSGLGSVTIKIGSTDGAADVFTETITPTWTKDGTDYSYNYSFDLPEDIIDGTYNINAVVYDGVENLTEVTQQIIVDNFSPNLGVVTAPFTGVKNENSFTWTYNYPDDILSVEYRVSTNRIGSMTTISNPVPGQTITFTNELTPSETYYIDVTLNTISGASHTSNDTIVYDDSNPLKNGDLSDLFPSFSKSGSLKVNWNTADLESGIVSIEHMVEQYKEGIWTEILDWESVGTISNSGSVEFRNLGLVHNDRIRVNQRVTNGVGGSAYRISSDIYIDDTIVNKLTNISDFSEYLKTTASPQVDWGTTETDNESGMDYYWAFSQNRSTFDLISDWRAPNVTKGAILDLTTLETTPQNGEKWYFIVKGVNGVGMETYGVSNGITFDDEAPDFAGVLLTADNNLTHLYYLTDEHEYLRLRINASDNLTSITYNADHGKFDVDGNYELLSEANVYTSNINDVNKEDLTGITGSIIFRADATDEADNSNNWGGTSAGTIYDSDIPVVNSVECTFADGVLTAGWNAEVGGSPILKYQIFLLKGSTPITLTDNEVHTRGISIDASSFDDGKYTLKVKAISESGLYSEDTAISKKIDILIDNKIPIVNSIVVDTIDTVPYVYKTINPEFDITEEGSSVKSYKYRIGTASDPAKLTGDWVSVEDVNITTGIFRPEIDLTENAAGYSKVELSDTLVMEVIIYDEAINESVSKKSNQFRLDKTLAQYIEISVPTLLKLNNQIINVSIEGQDLDSGIENIRMTLCKVVNGVDIKVGDLSRSADDLEITNEVNIEDFIFTKTGLELDDAATYRIQLDISNGTHVYNEVKVYSNIFTVDLTDPEITYGTFTTYQSPAPALPIFNNNNVDVINYTVNEASAIKFELFKDNVVDSVDTIIIPLVNANTTTSYTFNHNFDNEEEAYGNYTLKATVTDLAGNISEYNERDLNTISIRYNRPPEITYPTASYMTTPGQPFTIVPDSITDSEEDYPMTYSWVFDTDDNSNISASTDENPIVEFSHDSVSSDTTTYDITLTATDANGKSSTSSHSVTVKNTAKGTLYKNEYWMNDHSVTGDVVVPSNITLQVNENTTVNFFNGSGLNVDGRLTVLSGSTFTKGVDTSVNWAGVVISNTGRGSIGELDRPIVTIEKAVRGITIIDTGDLNLTNSTITNTLIQNNIIGVHVFDSNPTISNTTIKGNSSYGIKEDSAYVIEGDLIPVPIITNITYEENTIDYYDSVKIIPTTSGDNE